MRLIFAIALAGFAKAQDEPVGISDDFKCDTKMEGCRSDLLCMGPMTDLADAESMASLCVTYSYCQLLDQEENYEYRPTANTDDPSVDGHAFNMEGATCTLSQYKGEVSAVCGIDDQCDQNGDIKLKCLSYFAETEEGSGTYDTLLGRHCGDYQFCNGTGEWDGKQVDVRCQPDPTPDPVDPEPTPDPVDPDTTTPFYLDNSCATSMTNCDYNVKCMGPMKMNNTEDQHMCVHFSYCENKTHTSYTPQMGEYMNMTFDTSNATCTNSSHKGALGAVCEAPEQCKRAMNQTCGRTVYSIKAGGESGKMAFDPECIEMSKCGNKTEAEWGGVDVDSEIKCYGPDKSAIRIAFSFTLAVIMMYTSF